MIDENYWPGPAWDCMVYWSRVPIAAKDGDIYVNVMPGNRAYDLLYVWYNNDWHLVDKVPTLPSDISTLGLAEYLAAKKDWGKWQ